MVMLSLFIGLRKTISSYFSRIESCKWKTRFTNQTRTQIQFTFRWVDLKVEWAQVEVAYELTQSALEIVKIPSNQNSFLNIIRTWFVLGKLEWLFNWWSWEKRWFKSWSKWYSQIKPSEFLTNEFMVCTTTRKVVEFENFILQAFKVKKFQFLGS